MSEPVDPDRYADLKLLLACPKCGASGLIPVQQLDRALYCGHCRSLFRVEPHGLVELQQPQRERIAVQVRSNSSEWRGHQAVIVRPPSLGRRLRLIATQLSRGRLARCAAAAAVVILAVILWNVENAPPLEAAAVALPTELDERAVLLAESVVRRDLERLILLTDPGEHRALRTWLAHGAGLPPRLDPAESMSKPKLLRKAVTGTPRTQVCARVMLRVESGGESFVLDQRWAQKGSCWYFQPVRLRISDLPRPATAKSAGAARGKI